VFSRANEQAGGMPFREVDGKRVEGMRKAAGIAVKIA
jgi:hypothetical protein